MANPRELADQAFTLLQDALRDAEERVAELDAELKRKREPRDDVERRLEQLEAECEKWRGEAEHLEDLLQNERAKTQQLKKKLAAAESGPERLTRREINFWRQRAEEFDREAKQYRARIARLQHKLKERGGDDDPQTGSGDSEPTTMADDDAIEAARDESRELYERLEHEHDEAAESASRAPADELAESNRSLAEKEQQLGELEAQRTQLEQSLTEARAQIESLEAELREEKEVSDNLSELANERRETVTKLQERVEELEERYAESEWRLGKAKHFQRLVRRRKSLIRNLIATIRAKHKANTALKAGLDGLRRYKHTAEANQQKLLKRIDKLKAELEQTREKLAERTVAHRERPLEESVSGVPALEERLATQTEIIETLESELKAAKAAQRAREDETTELNELREAVEQKDEVIAEQQRDIEDQAQKLTRLRGSENETKRLEALAEQDKKRIEKLEREITQLREMLSSGGSDQTGAGDLAGKLEQHEESIAGLASPLEAKDAPRVALSESGGEHERKYEFVSTDARDGYKSAAHK